MARLPHEIRVELDTEPVAAAFVSIGSAFRQIGEAVDCAGLEIRRENFTRRQRAETERAQAERPTSPAAPPPAGERPDPGWITLSMSCGGCGQALHVPVPLKRPVGAEPTFTTELPCPVCHTVKQVKIGWPGEDPAMTAIRDHMEDPAMTAIRDHMVNPITRTRITFLQSIEEADFQRLRPDLERWLCEGFDKFRFDPTTLGALGSMARRAHQLDRIKMAFGLLNYEGTTEGPKFAEAALDAVIDSLEPALRTLVREGVSKRTDNLVGFISHVTGCDECKLQTSPGPTITWARFDLCEIGAARWGAVLAESR